MNLTYTNVEKSLRTPFLYLTSLINDRAVASIMPTSQHACRKIIEKLDFQRDLTVIEFGAGDGVLTEFILGKMSGRSRLFAVETNGAMIDALNERFDDTRLDILHENACSIVRVAQERSIRADVVISGIPMTMVSAEKRATLIKDIAAILKPGGLCITYQMWLPPLFRCKELRAQLSRHFHEQSVEDVYLNVPPLRIIVSALPRSRA